MEKTRIRRALVSVSDKTGIAEFAGELAAMEVEIVSTGGTAKELKQSGIEVTKVSQVTDHPEILGGRVKTLHPRIHGGILARRDKREDMDELVGLEITPIDLVVVNLYPFMNTVRKQGDDVETALENIDIGGPGMIRAAAKNLKGVAVICDPADYETVLKELKENNGQISLETRLHLAAKAFAHTTEYDAAIATYFGQLTGEENRLQRTEKAFPENLAMVLNKVSDLRYGENPHQRAALYADNELEGESLVEAEKLQGKALSYNNYMDMEGAWQLASEFRRSDKPFCAIIKHANPCGAAYGETAADAFSTALSCDPTSAFGGIIALNCEVDLEAAEEISKLFAECLIAPGYTEDALARLRKKKNLRVMRSPLRDKARGKDYRKISGGFLVADYDHEFTPRDQWETATERQPGDEEMIAMEFAWRVCKHVKSNSIVYTNASKILGVGAGQMSRVDSAKIAAGRFDKDEVEGPIVMASDAFFPFRDGLDMGAEAGATAVIQPGGSKRDDEVIAAANEHGIAMVFTGRRHFRH
jgi:phosphoribosylaminoimidazolecarboxamide formyltransferase/IMP cyclohydrolase